MQSASQKQLATARIPILMYHDLDSQRSPVSISPRSFSSQMQWLSQNDYTVLSLSTLAQMLNQKEPLPSRSVVITFDDGFASFYQYAFPILTEYQFPATVFLVSDYCSRDNAWPTQPASIPVRPLMTWQQIFEIERHGIGIGAHTASHPYLDQLDYANAEREMLDSKHKIEDEIGRAVDHFAYPYGANNETVKRIAQSIFSAICTTEQGRVQAGDNPLHLKRIEALYVNYPFFFRQQWRNSFSLYLAMRQHIRTLREK